MYVPRILLMLELCMSGQALSMLRRSALAHTMNAFIGRFMCSPPSDTPPATPPELVFGREPTLEDLGDFSSGNPRPSGTGNSTQHITESRAGNGSMGHGSNGSWVTLSDPLPALTERALVQQTKLFIDFTQLLASEHAVSITTHRQKIKHSKLLYDKHMFSVQFCL